MLQCRFQVISFFSAFLFVAGPVFASNVYVEPSQTLINNKIRIAAGSYSYYEFNLGAGSQLVAKFKVAGGLNNKAKVWLLDLDNFQRFKAGQRFSYYTGTSGDVRGIGSYTFKIPQTNVFYLVIDNRLALLLDRMVDLYVYNILPAETAQIAKQRESFEKVYQGLKQLFIFDDFQISFRHCGFENAFSNPNITLCEELQDSFQKMGIPGAMAFVFSHELGHTLLKLWGYPTWDNEDVADEFATVLSIIFKSTDPALDAAKWWANTTSTQEALSKLWVDDRHTISPQRARNIIRWLNSPDDLTHRWQKILVPNMQTAALQNMIDSEAVWFDRELARSELIKRNALASQQSRSNSAATQDSVRARVREAASAASATRTSIDVAISEGIRLGSLPLDPTQLGLEQSASYSTSYVRDVTYNKFGTVTVTLTDNAELGDAAGKKIVFVPRSTQNKVTWSLSSQTTVPRHYLTGL